VTLRLRRTLWLLAAGAVALLPLLLDHLATPDAATRLGAATFGRTPDDDRARPVTLPHRWGEDAAADCSDCRSVWYGLDVELAALPRETKAVLLPRVERNAAVYLNGRLLAQGGRFGDPAARLDGRPLWAAAPPTSWNAGPNRLFVLVNTARPGLSLMPAPALGDESALRGVFELRQALVVTLPQVAATAAAMLAGVMGLLWAYRRQDRRQAAHHAALTLACGLFAAQAFAGLVVEPPWSDALWDATLAAAALLMSGAVLRLGLLLGLGRPQGRAAAAWAALLSVSLAAAIAAGLDGEGRALHLAQQVACLLPGLAGAAWVWGGWRQGDGRLAVPGAWLLAASGHDLLRLPLDPDALPALPLALAVMLGVAAWMLLLRFVQTLNAVELLKVDLESLVDERTAALQAQFARVRELERRQTIADERERLMRDMHDGVGGHLVSMLAMIEADRRRPGELAAVVRDALDDMRLMVDSLEPVDDDLNAVLAMFHDRLAPRLGTAQVALHWDVDLLPPVPGLTPARVLHVLRILQEGVTNAIRHGQARTLWLAAHVDEGQQLARLSLRDDGCGFDPAQAASGRGLKNMRRRAAEVGAAIEVQSAAGRGTQIELTLPMARP
jgi:signal transduction histidine kinase